MEAHEEVMGSKDHTQIIRGKRTKRQRQPSPLALTMASSSSSAGEFFGGGGRVSDNCGVLDHATPSPTTSLEFAESTEEEDMAKCLILLAKGASQSQKPSEPIARAATTTTKAAGFYVYECKTCNRCFPSFQALGGHRASHKKPRAVIEEKKVSVLMDREEEDDVLNNTTTTLSLQIANRASSYNTNKSKVHECSVCGAEFSSGQALGGHMRRHRTFTSNPTSMGMATSSSDLSQEAKKPRNILSLDLNLPAPDDDFRESKFPFASKEQVLVFSASPLVDCHY